MNESLSGKLLVATPALLDPNFNRTVVLICAEGDEGTLGVVLNRPLDADVVDHLPQWRHRVASPPVFFQGGPVELTGALGLGRHRGGGGGEGWTRVLDGVGLLDLGRGPDGFGEGLREVRLFSGHAGWSVEQLEAEIAEGSWFVVDAEPGDAFTREPGRLWREVLRRQPGSLAMFALFPPDPALN